MSHYSYTFRDYLLDPSLQLQLNNPHNNPAWSQHPMWIPPRLLSCRNSLTTRIEDSGQSVAVRLPTLHYNLRKLAFHPPPALPYCCDGNVTQWWYCLHHWILSPIANIKRIAMECYCTGYVLFCL